jgi:hypothetical protein
MYEFNEHLICTNPTIAFKYESKKLTVELRIASYNDLWDFGLSVDVYGLGVGWGVCSTWVQYPTKEIAVANGIAKLTEILMKWVAGGEVENNEAQKVITQMEALIKPKVEQLQLF